MKRTTILLPDDLAALLERERRRRDVPVSAVVREALTQYLTDGPHGEDAPRFSFIGAGHSGQTGAAPLSERVEEILTREWSGDDLAGGRNP